MTYREEPVFEKVITETFAGDAQAPNGIVIGWAVLVASRVADDQVYHSWYTPSGQPHYASVGLLTATLDQMREVSRGGDE